MISMHNRPARPEALTLRAEVDGQEFAVAAAAPDEFLGAHGCARRLIDWYERVGEGGTVGACPPGEVGGTGSCVTERVCGKQASE